MNILPPEIVKGIKESLELAPKASERMDEMLGILSEVLEVLKEIRDNQSKV